MLLAWLTALLLALPSPRTSFADDVPSGTTGTSLIRSDNGGVGYSVTISLPREEYLQGELLLADVVLRNVTDHPIECIVPLYSGSDYLGLEIRDTNMKSVPSHSGGYACGALTRSACTLGPGEELRTVINLTDEHGYRDLPGSVLPDPLLGYIGSLPAGRYTVQASFPGKAAIGLTTVVYSNTVTFSVREFTLEEAESLRSRLGITSLENTQEYRDSLAVVAANASVDEGKWPLAATLYLDSSLFHDVGRLERAEGQVIANPDAMLSGCLTAYLCAWHELQGIPWPQRFLEDMTRAPETRAARVLRSGRYMWACLKQRGW